MGRTKHNASPAFYAFRFVYQLRMVYWNRSYRTKRYTFSTLLTSLRTRREDRDRTWNLVWTITWNVDRQQFSISFLQNLACLIGKSIHQYQMDYKLEAAFGKMLCWARKAPAEITWNPFSLKISDSSNKASS